MVSHGNLSCRICSMCMLGREYDCEKRLVWGFQTGPLWGVYCQYAHLPEVNVAKINDNISFEERSGDLDGGNDFLAHAS